MNNYFRLIIGVCVFSRETLRVFGAACSARMTMVKKLLLFPSTYLCECGFSTLLHVKTKNQNRLNFFLEGFLSQMRSFHNVAKNWIWSKTSHIHTRVKITLMLISQSSSA